MPDRQLKQNLGTALSLGRNEGNNKSQYPDGCLVSPTCLECPLPACKHDGIKEYRYYRLYLGRELREEVVKAFSSGHSAIKVASMFEVDERTAYRWQSLIRSGKFNKYDIFSVVKENK